jgi:UbiA prenyltransferase family
MARWLTYIKERYPLPTYLILSGTICWSASMLHGGTFGARPGEFLVALAGILLFFFELRLMDEWKDFEKDKIAHPGRPLPRGLLAPAEVRRSIALGLAAMVMFSGALVALGHGAAGAVYLATTLYLWLMYREFFVGKVLSQLPFAYGFTHQLILVPLVAFPVAVLEPEAWMRGRSLEYALTVLGAFFTYELCRKLDPRAHPVLKTYPQVYGKGGTFFRISITTSLALLGSSLLHAEWVTTLPVLATWLAALAWVGRPGIHKWVELMATLSLLVHLACIPIKHWVSPS